MARPQTWNLAHTLHGHMFWVQDFTPKYSVIYNFFLSIIQFIPTKKWFFLYVTLISNYVHLFIHVFPKKISFWAQIVTIKSKTFQQEVNLWQTAYVQSYILPQRWNFLHGQCPCVRDKFHVWKNNQILLSFKNESI